MFYVDLIYFASLCFFQASGSLPLLMTARVSCWNHRFQRLFRCKRRLQQLMMVLHEHWSGVIINEVLREIERYQTYLFLTLLPSIRLVLCYSLVLFFILFYCMRK